MSNIRTLGYDNNKNRLFIKVKGKPHYFKPEDTYKADMPGYAGVKVGARNFFFATDNNFDSGMKTAYWNIKDNKISRTIPPLQFPRVRADIGLWRAAIIEMEMKPWNWRVTAMLIMQDTLLDAHVKACWNKRKRLTLLKKPLFYDKKGNPVENNPNLDFINSDWWHQMIDFTLDAQGYGYQLIELGEMNNYNFPDISVVPRQNISPDREVVVSVVRNVGGMPFNVSPSKDTQLFNINKGDSIDVNGKKINVSPKAPNGEYYFDWNLWITTPNEFGAHTSTCGYGLFYWVSLYALMIRNNLQNNANFNEIFIQPIVWLKTIKSSEEERSDTFKELAKMGASRTILTDPQDELSIVETKTLGEASKTYGDMEDRLKKSISALILGHEGAMMTQPKGIGGKDGSSTSKGGKSDSEVQIALGETESEQDRWICAQVNDKIIPKLRNIGFNIPYDVTYGYPNDREENEEQERQNKYNIDFSSVLVNLNTAGYEVSEAYIEEITGIPVTKKAVAPVADTDEQEIKDVTNLLESIKTKYQAHKH